MQLFTPKEPVRETYSVRLDDEAAEMVDEMFEAHKAEGAKKADIYEACIKQTYAAWKAAQKKKGGKS